MGAAYVGYIFLIKTDNKAEMSSLNVHSVAPRGWYADSLLCVFIFVHVHTYES